ncbi:MAG TPA: glycosyltransferase family 9 protein [Aromatoleum sp.]|uniref:glycosyltransferase family 9 protein n=1 Tax=Aromatoleum sp. TaxID=2307007 RepID=UPI002B4A8F96|nr:glycosyltransferase family 9 protein [Aromatoleum sp.]HJV24644.1 glycosyltransferase family 9 protein [Aromatoleum sp.]
MAPPAAHGDSALSGRLDIARPTGEDTAAAEAAVRTAGWADARRVLAVRLDNLGDVLMTTPALRALRQSASDVRVTLLAGGAGAALAPYLPEVDEVIVAGCPWMPGSESGADSMEALVARLRAERFDAAVIFTVYSQSALPAAMLCWMAGIPLRLAHCRENPYHLLTDWVPDPEPHEILRHEVRRQLDLVAFVGAHTPDERLSFRVDAGDRHSAIARLREAGVDPLRPYAVVHPGASALSRRYPPELFAAALRQFTVLAGEGAPQLVLTGDAGEAELVESVRSACGPTVSLAGKLSLGELAAVLERAAILIANNTGPVHLAAALGVPVVDLYALTNPQHAPWKTPCRVLYEDVPCRYCYRSVCPQGHHACLHLLDPERVAIAARELLDHGAEAAVLPFGIAKG